MSLFGFFKIKLGYREVDILELHCSFYFLPLNFQTRDFRLEVFVYDLDLASHSKNIMSMQEVNECERCNINYIQIYS